MTAPASPRPTPPEGALDRLLRDYDSKVGRIERSDAAHAELAALRQERNDALDGECVLAEQIEAEILTRAKAEKEVAALRARVADLELIARDIKRGRFYPGMESLVLQGGDWMIHGRILKSDGGLPVLDEPARSALRKDVDQR